MDQRSTQVMVPDAGLIFGGKDMAHEAHVMCWFDVRNGGRSRFPVEWTALGAQAKLGVPVTVLDYFFDDGAPDGRIDGKKFLTGDFEKCVVRDTVVGHWTLPG